MKKILIVLCALSIIACEKKEEAPKDYVTFSGKITNQNSDSIVLRTREYSKTIKVNEDGTFSDTLKVETGLYNFYDGKKCDIYCLLLLPSVFDHLCLHYHELLKHFIHNTHM